MTTKVEPPLILPDDFDNKAGSAFFGIDGHYLAQVQKKEMFYLIGYGFDYQSIYNMSLEERRYFFHLWLEMKEKEREANSV